MVDGSGGLGDAACAPVREYLKQRPDTVRTIVTMLTEEANTSLMREV